MGDNEGTTLTAEGVRGGTGAGTERQSMQQHPTPQFRGAILIADDHEIFRFGLAQLLRNGLGAQTILEAEDFEQALEQLENKDLNLAIIDLGMPGLPGPDQLAQIRIRRPDVRVVVISGSDSREDILAALAAGVHGYIVKSQRTGALIDRLRYVLSGEIYVPPNLAEQPSAPLRGTMRQAEPRPTAEPLSDRQRQVLEGLVEGLSNKEIARQLGISEGTVKMHIAALFRLLGATNRTHAVALGKQLLG
jgi:DNA-binding NarL/FixJ family response regulator